MRSNRYILFWITWLTDAAAMLLVFTVTRTLAERGVSLITMGLLGGGISMGLALMCLVSGRIADRLSLRWPMFAGTVMLMASLVGCLLLQPTQPAYYLLYVISGAAAGMIYPPLICALTVGRSASDHLRGMSRVLVIFCLSWNLGLIAGQLGGGWLFAFDHTLPLLAAILVTLINAGLVLSLKRRATGLTSTSEDSETTNREHQVLSAAFARLAWLANLGGTFAFSMVLHLFPRVVVTLDIPSERHGTLLAITRAMAIAMYLFMAWTQFWRHRFITVVVSHLLAVAGLLVISVAQSELGLLLGLAGFAQMSGYNYFAGLYYTTTGSDDAHKGAATGFNEATLAFGFACGSICGGVIGHIAGERSPYRLAAAVIGALLLIQVFAYKRSAMSLRNHIGVASAVGAPEVDPPPPCQGGLG